MKNFFVASGIFVLIIAGIYGLSYYSYKVGYTDAFRIAGTAAKEVIIEEREQCASAVQFVLSKTCPDLHDELLGEIKKEKGEKLPNEKKLL